MYLLARVSYVILTYNSRICNFMIHSVDKEGCILGPGAMRSRRYRAGESGMELHALMQIHFTGRIRWKLSIQATQVRAYNTSAEGSATEPRGL